jgi:hypothetical protein
MPAGPCCALTLCGRTRSSGGSSLLLVPSCRLSRASCAPLSVCVFIGGTAGGGGRAADSMVLLPRSRKNVMLKATATKYTAFDARAAAGSAVELEQCGVRALFRVGMDDVSCLAEIHYKFILSCPVLLRR